MIMQVLQPSVLQAMFLEQHQAAVIGQTPNVLANPDLKWEKSQTYDFGLDFGILKNRITGSFDYYNKLNTDLLLNVQVPEVTGFQTYLTNIGSVRNIGQELEITSRNMVGKFQWTTSINVTHNTNKIVALAPGQTQIIIPNGFTVSDADFACWFTFKQYLCFKSDRIFNC